MTIIDVMELMPPAHGTSSILTRLDVDQRDLKQVNKSSKVLASQLQDFLECPDVGRRFLGQLHRGITRVASVQECYRLCLQPWQCTHYTYKATSGYCRLLKTLERIRDDDEFVSGAKYCNPENYTTPSSPSTPRTTTPISSSPNPSIEAIRKPNFNP